MRAAWGGRKGVCVGGSNLALTFCSWANLNQFINLSELRCPLLQSRYNHTSLQEWWWNYMMIVTASGRQSRFSTHIYIPHLPSSSCITDVGTERGLFRHVKILRPCPSWKGQRKREVRASRLTSLTILRPFACCWMKIIVLHLQGFMKIKWDHFCESALQM